MRCLLVPSVAMTYWLLGGCAVTPNQPTLVLQTNKSPEQYAECVVPKLQDRTQTPTLSQTRRHYRVVVSSTLAADNVLEAYKTPTGGKVFLYERRPVASGLIPSSFERAARECL